MASDVAPSCSSLHAACAHLGRAAGSVARHLAFAAVHQVVYGLHRGCAILLEVRQPQGGTPLHHIATANVTPYTAAPSQAQSRCSVAIQGRPQ